MGLPYLTLLNTFKINGRETIIYNATLNIGVERIYQFYERWAEVKG